MKAMIITIIFLAVAIGFVMMLKGQAEKQPIPTDRAVADVKSTDWKKYGTDEDGDHFFRFDGSSKAFPDILSVKTHGHHDWRLLEKRDHPCVWRETQRIADLAHHNGVL